MLVKRRLKVNRNRSSYARSLLAAFCTGLLGLAACSLADIRPSDLRPSVGDENIACARNFLNVGNGPAAGMPDRLKMIVKDEWESSFLRSFTPLTGDTQSLRIAFSGTNISAEFLDGDNKGDVILLRDRVGLLQSADAEPEPDDEARIYLESFRLYLLLRSLAMSMETVACVDGEYPAMDLYSRDEYAVMFASDGAAEPSDDHDQYLLYFHRESGNLEAALFTYREVFSFYTGVLVFTEFTDVDGMVLPRAIEVRDDFQSESYVHRFTITYL